MIKPDYENNILSLSNSLLSYFGAKSHHATLPQADALLAKGYRNVILLIMDGLGINVLRQNLPEDSFLFRHIRSKLSSVYPPTTTAALTSILCGLSPIEHGWLGWSCYFHEIEKCVDLFSGYESGTERNAFEEYLPGHLLPYETILSQINHATNGAIKTYTVSPFSEYYANTIEGICKQIQELSSVNETKLIFAYLNQPDSDLHEYGVCTQQIKSMLTDYNRQLEELTHTLYDTLLLITADHGMTNIHMKCVEDYPAIHATLARPISIEPRCCSFFVKDTYRVIFPELFHDTFGDQFVLFTHDSFLESGLLGGGIPHVKTNDFIGDFVAIAVGNTALWYRDENGKSKDFKGAHAGLTMDELYVPLIVVEIRQ